MWQNRAVIKKISLGYPKVVIRVTAFTDMTLEGYAIACGRPNFLNWARPLSRIDIGIHTNGAVELTSCLSSNYLLGYIFQMVTGGSTSLLASSRSKTSSMNWQTSRGGIALNMVSY